MSATGQESQTARALLETVVEHLASIYRPSCSPGEREAAEWIAERLNALETPARVEPEAAYASYWWTLATWCGLGVLAGIVGTSRRWLGVLLGLASGAGIADEISNGRRPLRPVLLRRQTAWNVIGEGGDPSADRTLVLLAHHDAPHSGLVFDQTLQRKAGERWPDLIERTDTAIPIWAPVFGPPFLIALGLLLRRPRLVSLATLFGIGSTAAFLDIARRPAVPGANDNLSGVAAMVAVAAALRERPVSGLRVLFVSCGAEESLQEGIRPFMQRHSAQLPVETTSFLNLETVGSPRLALLEGEGPMFMEDYHGGLSDFVAETAERAGIALRRGLRARASTDSIIPSRAGYETATICSVDRNKALSNYHWPSDIPANLDYETVDAAARLAEAVVRRLAEER